MSAEEAANKLDERIAQGREIESRDIRGITALEAARADHDRWSAFNAELLRNLFTTPELADEYTQFYGAVVRMNAGFQDRVHSFRQSAADGINRLLSIRERIPLFESYSLGTSPTSAELDPVTQIPSRAAQQTELPSAWKDAVSLGQPLAIILVDIDWFKRVNDTYGHPKGDEVLRGVAQTLRRVVSGKGSVYRYGGEEFLISLLNYDAGEAIALAERARRSISSTEHAGLAVTVSLGVAISGEHGDTLDQVIGSADTALYDAKKGGRNLVRQAGDAKGPNVLGGEDGE